VLRSRYFQDNDTGLLRILSEAEWRGIGITQSLGWEVSFSDYGARVNTIGYENPGLNIRHTLHETAFRSTWYD
jgi:hypothetical protein